MLGEERIALVIILPEDLKEEIRHLKVRLAAVVATYVSGKRLEDRLVELGKCQCEFDKLWLSDEGRKQIWSVLATADQALHNYQQWRGGMPPDEQTKQAPPPAYNLSHLVAGWVKPSATSE